MSSDRARSPNNSCNARPCDNDTASVQMYLFTLISLRPTCWVTRSIVSTCHEAFALTVHQYCSIPPPGLGSCGWHGLHASGLAALYRIGPRRAHFRRGRVRLHRSSYAEIKSGAFRPYCSSRDQADNFASLKARYGEFISARSHSRNRLL